MAANKYYVVWKGRRTGLFSNWMECQSAVMGFSGAQYIAFSSYEEANEAIKGRYEDYCIKGEVKIDREKNRCTTIPLQDALSVDAACRGNPGVMEYRGVWVKDGKEYFRMGPYPEGTVNIGEFLAIVHGLALLKKEGLTVPVYTDSKTAMKWVKDCRANTKLEPNEINRKLFEYLKRAEEWLKANHYTNPVLKWDTATWGEIPADYGRK